MALPAHVLERLPPEIRRGSAAFSRREPLRSLPLGLSALDAALPDSGLLRGGIVELSVSGTASLATSIALFACRSAQQDALARGGEVPWCAFIDPSNTLYGPGVAQTGVVLERLVVVRPPLEALSRVALRMVKSRIFSVTVIDTVGMPGSELNVALGTWPRLLRQMSMLLEGSPSCLLLITDSRAARPLPLPVAMRIELKRAAESKLVLEVAKDNRGRISRPCSIAWTRTVPAAAAPTSDAEHGWAQAG
jgi:recombination protein RecA